MKAGMVFLGVFGLLTLSFVAAILAALSAALLFVRGAIVGAQTLLGLGRSLSGFAGDVEREVFADLTPLVLFPLEFVSVARRTDVERVPATDAGRVRPFWSEPEDVRLITGGAWRRKLEGGVWSFMARSAALRLVLGATVGTFVLATEIVSLLLWPGTPSKVP